MSICAITTGNQSCKVEIKCMLLSYVLKESDKDYCAIDFIAEVIKGNMDFLDIYVPFNISNWENRTPNMLDENNIYLYHPFKSYEIIKRHTKNTGEISINKCKASIRSVNFNPTPIDKTFIGDCTKIDINFNETVPSGKKRAIRLLLEFNKFDRICEKINDHYDIYLNYYNQYYLNNLNLHKVNIVSAKDIAVWVAAPPNTKAGNFLPSNPEPRTWPYKDFKFDSLESIFGEITHALFNKFPIKSFKWSKESMICKELILDPQNHLKINFNYTFTKSKSDEKPVIEDDKKKEEKKKKPYVVYLSKQGGHRSERNTFFSEEKIESKYLNKKNKYAIFIHNRKGWIKIRLKDTEEKEIVPIDVERKVFNLLILFLKYKDVHLSYEELYKNAWESSQDIDLNAIGGGAIVDHLKTAVSKLRKAFKDIEEFEISRASYGGFTCEGNFKFCLIVNESIDHRYTLSEG